MSEYFCSEHADRPAVFYCEGCARMLCNDCVREGHRLFFCRYCGERAMAADSDLSSSVTERQRAEKVSRPYSLREALAYAFRGSGRPMLPAYVLLLTAASLLPSFGPAVATLVMILTPGLVLEIVRTTAAGGIELPEWPDYSDPGLRSKEFLWLLLVAVTALLPLVVIFYLAGCDLVSLFMPVAVPGAAFCWGPRLAGIALGTVLGVFALGATGTHSSGWLSFRVDLHLEALLSGAGRDALKVAGLLTLLFAGSTLLRQLLAGTPVLGTALGAALSGYAWFTGAHLVGLVFRRHGAELDPIYRA